METQKRLKIDFQDSVVMDQKLKAVLERLLEPAPEDRFQVHCFVDMHIFLFLLELKPGVALTCTDVVMNMHRHPFYTM